MTEERTGTGYEPLRYHQATKHSPKSVRAGSHRIDFMDRPDPFKRYLELDPIPLPHRAPDTRFPATEAVAGRVGPRRPLDLPV